MRDAGLPTLEYALEKVRWDLAYRIKKVDAAHVLAQKAAIPAKRGGRGRDRPFAPVSKIQRAATLLPEAQRPTRISPRYRQGSRKDPTDKQPKKEAAKIFREWLETVDQTKLVVYTDGSKGDEDAGYGYAIFHGNAERPILTGHARLEGGEVFDAEGVGAWRGLEAALSLTDVTPGITTVTVCLDNTAAIWSIQGTASHSSQWAFLAFQEQVDARGTVDVRWCPGHMGILGNELADKEAKKGAKRSAPLDPVPGLSLAALKAKKQSHLNNYLSSAWMAEESQLSAQYRQWGLEHKLTMPEELMALTRPQLHRLNATRSGHGDFAWYHNRFQHENTNLLCTCGREKAPNHIVRCRKMLAKFDLWPWPWDIRARPREKPWTRRAGLQYLAELMKQPKLYRELLEKTGFYTDICPRGPPPPQELESPPASPRPPSPGGAPDSPHRNNLGPNAPAAIPEGHGGLNPPPSA